jgi:hypothetical protein
MDQCSGFLEISIAGVVLESTREADGEMAEVSCQAHRAKPRLPFPGAYPTILPVEVPRSVLGHPRRISRVPGSTLRDYRITISLVASYRHGKIMLQRWAFSGTNCHACSPVQQLPKLRQTAQLH